jgi:HlyD family secretion protein
MWITLVSITVLVLSILLWPRSVLVDTVTVKKGQMSAFIHEDGVTRVREKYIVSTPVSGKIERIELEAGDTVTAKETVLVSILPIDPAMQDFRSRKQQESQVEAAIAAVKLAKADLTRVQSELEFARHEFERNDILATKGTISPSALERFEINLKTATAAVSAAEAFLEIKQSELQTARAGLISPDPESRLYQETDRIDIHAHTDGLVLQILREDAGFVTAGEPLMEIGNARQLEIVADVLSVDAVAVEEGAEVTIRGWGGSEELSGRVRRIEPFGYTKVSALGIEEQRVDAVIDFVDPSEKWIKLGHGYRVKVDITTWHADDVMHLPVSTLFRKGNQWAVYAVIGSRAELVPVEVGVMTNTQAQILSGLGEDSRIISYPSDEIKSGTRVRMKLMP